jgi:hypothetical protein
MIWQISLFLYVKRVNMKKLLLFLLPLFLYAEQSEIYRIGSASLMVNENETIGGTLLGYKRHVADGEVTYAGDINYIMVDANPYGIGDTMQAMIHLGRYATTNFEYYGSFGYAFQGDDRGFGWGVGLVYDIADRFSLTYEYRKFTLEDASNNSYDLKTGSLGLLIRL